MTKTTKMSIQRALDQINLLEKRIASSYPDYRRPLISSALGETSIQDFKDDADFATQAQATLDKVNALIIRRDAIKSAIIVKNATTEIVVGKDKMTIASAIERRTSIKYKVELLNVLKGQYVNEMRKYEASHDRYSEKLKDQLEALYGKEYKAKDAEEALKPFNKIHKPRLVNPLDLKKVIDELAEEIDAFESEIKFALTEANVRTEIVVPA